jgi:hypothetical protein
VVGGSISVIVIVSLFFKQKGFRVIVVSFTSMKHICHCKNTYSLRLILLFVNTDVSNTKIYLDTFILAKSNISQRKYIFFAGKKTHTFSSLTIEFT